jgi:hypothetical protein
MIFESVDLAHAPEPSGGSRLGWCDFRERQLEHAGCERQVGDRGPGAGDEWRLGQSDIEH